MPEIFADIKRMVMVFSDFHAKMKATFVPSSLVAIFIAVWEKIWHEID